MTIILRIFIYKQMSRIAANDQIIFDVCMALNCCVCPNITPDGDLKPFSNQLTSFKNLFSCYCNMDVSHGKPFLIGLQIWSIMSIVTFQLQIVTRLSCGQNLWLLEKTKPTGREPLIAEICLCAPFSNATLERFFSHINIKKSKTNDDLMISI